MGFCGNKKAVPVWYLLIHLVLGAVGEEEPDLPSQVFADLEERSIYGDWGESGTHLHRLSLHSSTHNRPCPWQGMDGFSYNTHRMVTPGCGILQVKL